MRTGHFLAAIALLFQLGGVWNTAQSQEAQNDPEMRVEHIIDLCNDGDMALEEQDQAKAVSRYQQVVREAEGFLKDFPQGPETQSVAELLKTANEELQRLKGSVTATSTVEDVTKRPALSENVRERIELITPAPAVANTVQFPVPKGEATDSPSVSAINAVAGGIAINMPVTRAEGGVALSLDRKVELKLEPGAVGAPSLKVTIRPIAEVSPGEGYVRIGRTYEILVSSWPGIVKPARLTMRFDESALDTNGDGKADVPLDRLGIYYYRAGQGRWRPIIPCALQPEKRELVAQISNIWPGRKVYYSLFADTACPEAPVVDAAPSPVEQREILLTGSAEQNGKVEVVRGADVIAICFVGDEGKFQLSRVPLAVGPNILDVYARDSAGNRSEKPARVEITRILKIPRKVMEIAIEGPDPLTGGASFRVRLTGEDADPANVNRAYAMVRSTQTDLKGLEIELLETKPDSGVYVTGVTVGDATDAGQQVIGARVHKETITVTSAQDASKTISRSFFDDRASAAPVITTTPAACLQEDTFERAQPEGLGGWKTIDERRGAALMLVHEDKNVFLRLMQQEYSSHLGALIRNQGYEPKNFPLLAFDYRLSSKLEFDMAVSLDKGGTWAVRFNDSRPFYKPAGEFKDVVADGAWHYAEVNMKDVCDKAVPTPAAGARVLELSFINWDGSTALDQQYGSRIPPGASYDIDNFRIFRPLTKGDVEFRWSCDDPSGIQGYSFVLDANPNTVPPPAVSGMAPSQSFTKLEDGRWYFHVRALDGAGNWGPANHAMVLVQKSAPKIDMEAAPVAGH